MTLGQIKSFVAVATERSFAKAANTLFVSQPAISKSIASFEEELGFSLLNRKGGDVSLTPAGRKLYELFIRIETDYKNTIADIHQMIETFSETIRIGCADTWRPDLFYGKISNHFQENFPHVRLEIECTRMPDLLEGLQSGKFDIILTYDPHRHTQYGFSGQKLTDIECGLLYSKEHFPNVRDISDLGDAAILTFDVDFEKKFAKFLAPFIGDSDHLPKLRNYNRFMSAIFNMSCGNGVLLYTEWDNIVTNTQWGSFPLPYRAPINIVYSNNSDKPGIDLFVKEIIGLFKQEPRPDTTCLPPLKGR